MNGAKTASVKSVTTDTKILDAKKIETAELLVDGVSISEIVPKWKPREHIYRCVLEEDDDFIIYDDEGNFLDCKLDTLENGTGLFQGTKGVEEFSFSLPSLTTGSNMFANCNLGEKAVESILRTIPEYSEGSHPLTMNMSTDAFEKFNEITGNILGEPGTISYKGWNITSNAVVALPEGYRKVEYLESTGIQYISTNLFADTQTGGKITEAQTTEGTGTPLGGTNRFAGPGNMRWYVPHIEALGYLQWGWKENLTSPSSVKLFEKQTSSLNWLNDKKAKGPDFEVSLDNNTTIYGVPINLFAYPGEEHTNIVYWDQCRIYHAAVSHDLEVIRNFIPCIDNLGNPCMYDLVTKETFHNEGSGTFLTPESATTYSLRQPVPTYARMTAHGVQKLYYTPESYEGSEDEYAQENGFKLLTENERPEEGSWRPEWVETDNELILNWIEVEEGELTNV